MKDAKGHGSNPRGEHSAGIDQVGQPETALVQDYHDRLFGALGKPEFSQVHEELKSNPQMSNDMVADLAKKFNYGRRSDSRKKNLEHINSRHMKLMDFIRES